MSDIQYQNELKRYENDLEKFENRNKFSFISSKKIIKRPEKPKYAQDKFGFVKVYSEDGKLNIWFDGRIAFDKDDFVLAKVCTSEFLLDHEGIPITNMLMEQIVESITNVFMKIDRIKNQVYKIDFKKEAETGVLIKA